MHADDEQRAAAEAEREVRVLGIGAHRRIPAHRGRLALGQHDPDYVDAFYGPAEWKADAGRQKMPLPEIDVQARVLGVAPNAPVLQVRRKRQVQQRLRGIVRRHHVDLSGLGPHALRGREPGRLDPMRDPRADAGT